MQITSRDNALIRRFRKLVSDGKFRRETGLFALEGARLCEDAIRSSLSVEAVLYTVQAQSRYPEQVALLLSAAPAYEIPESLAEYISDTKAPQGVFCIAKLPEQAVGAAATIDPKGRYAALEAVQDPGNLGTMIRTAEALGLDGLLLSDGCCDPYNPKVLRSSMGGVFRLPLYAAGDLSVLLPSLSARGFVSVACVVEATAVPIQSLSLGAGSIAVIGNEGNGLMPQTVQACTVRATIPMRGRAESLNASMAAGIVLWEMMRGEGMSRG